MGTIFVDTLEPQSGTSLTLGASGDTIALTSGAIQSNFLTPAFHAYASGGGSNQTVSDATATKITLFDTELFDTDNCFASNRFTPTVAGKYFVYTNMYWDTGTVNDYHNGSVQLRKNGSNYAMIDNNWNASGGNAMSNHVGAIMDMNGSSDYVEVYVYQNTASGASVTVYDQSNITQFGAYRVGT